LLNRLYDDSALIGVLERHEVAIVRSTGSLRTRFHDPTPLTSDLVTELYLDVGLSAARISLVTGHEELAVRRALQEAGVPARDGSRSPWSNRHRD
jgi:hypothetical protein